MKIVLYGGTGYVGRKTAAVGFRLGHSVQCPTRGNQRVEGACCVPFDTPLPSDVDLVISCMASSTGTDEDCELVDNLANQRVASACQRIGCKFIYVSGQCVTLPRLGIQKAKLRCERFIQNCPGLDWVIVRPTALFKSFVPVVERVMQGKSCLVFGSGRLGRFHPIDAAELGSFLIEEASNHSSAILPVGGPKCPENMLTSISLTRRCFEVWHRPCRIRHLPPAVFWWIARLLRILGRVSRRFTVMAVGIELWVYYTTTDLIGRAYGKRTFEDWIQDVQRGCEDVDPKALNMESPTWRL